MLKPSPQLRYHLKLRVLAQMLLVGLVLLSLTGVGIDFFIDRIFTQEVERRATTILHAIEAAALSAPTPADLSSALVTISKGEDIDAIYVISGENPPLVISSTDPKLLNRPIAEIVSPRQVKTIEASFSSGSITRDSVYERNLILSAPVQLSWQKSDANQKSAIHLVVDTRRVYANISVNILELVALFAVMLSGILIIGYLVMQRDIFDPLNKINAALRRRTEGDTSARPTIIRDDEIGQVAQTLTTMLDVLAQNEQERIADQAKVVAYAQQLEGKNMEIEMARNTAERATTLKSQFLANMSHEIRTPINGVIGMTNLLLETPLEAKQKHYVETAQQSAEFLLVLINDILDLSKIESGKLKLEPIPFDLPALLQSIINLLQPKAQKKGVELLTFNMTEIPRYLIGDTVRLNQILTNLVDNAIKFTNQGYVKIIMDRDETSSAVPNMIKLKFAVRDTGVGIPLNAQQMIFEKFTQADASTTRKFGGTGLGLAISKQLVELMGGQIGVESTPGSGSVFWFTVPLPLAPSAVLPPQQQEEPLPNQALDFVGKHVLVAEDNEVNRFFAGELLSQLGFRVTMVNNGLEAIAARREHDDIDVVLMDCQMPEMDGFAATRAIRALEEQGIVNRVPIIAITALAMKGDRERCIDSGMDDYVTKPLRKPELLRALAQHILGHPTDDLQSERPVTVPDTHYVDANILKDVQEFMGDKFLSVIQLYLHDAERAINTIIFNLEQGPPNEALSQAAHSLRSSSAHLGALKLAHYAERIETAVNSSLRNQKPLAPPINTTELQQVFLDTQAQMTPYLLKKIAT